MFPDNSFLAINRAISSPSQVKVSLCRQNFLSLHFSLTFVSQHNLIATVLLFSRLTLRRSSDKNCRLLEMIVKKQLNSYF